MYHVGFRCLISLDLDTTLLTGKGLHRKRINRVSGSFYNYKDSPFFSFTIIEMNGPPILSVPLGMILYGLQS